jgi:MtN3 and saliva related transmembrane protein
MHFYICFAFARLTRAVYQQRPFMRSCNLQQRYNHPPVKQSISAMTVTDWTGSSAAALTTIAFIPQAWKVWRTKHTADISLGMYVLFTAGVALWLAYGLMLDSWPIIIANSVTLLLAGIVLAMKIKFG